MPYFIAAHPGCDEEDMLKLSLWRQRKAFGSGRRGKTRSKTQTGGGKEEEKQSQWKIVGKSIDSETGRQKL